jgi:hypothetical protein
MTRPRRPGRYAAKLCSCGLTLADRHWLSRFAIAAGRMHGVDIAALLSGISVVLAFVVFLRDRMNQDRQQVDRLGAWTRVKYERRSPIEAERIEEGEIAAHIRNASELPVRVRQIAYRTTTTWLVGDKLQSGLPGGPGVWTPTPGTEPLRNFHEDVVIPPGETQQLTFIVNVAHTAPADAVQLDMLRGIDCHIDWLLVLDNAGRRWHLRPEKGRRARRVRGWRWRPGEYMPRTW